MKDPSPIHTLPIDKLLTSSLAAYRKEAPFPSGRIKKHPFWRRFWNERQLKKLINDLFNDLDPYMPAIKKHMETDMATPSSELEEVRNTLVTALKEIDERKLLFDQPFLNSFIKEDFMDVAESFMTRAKKEDGDLTNEEIFQALRNVWIMNSLQLYWDMPLELTTPMYAYSMLYPYTDNLLDDPEIDHKTKQLFNDKLSKALSRKTVQSEHSTEKRNFSLVEQIKRTFPQEFYPGVTKSIQLIHSAQIESMLQGQDTPLSEEVLLRITFYKGGTSVLADAYLIKGHVSEEEQAFAFHFGAFLQLLDDLQDKKEDEISHNQTLFSREQSREKTDEEIRHLITYIFAVNTKVNSDSKNTALLKNVISQCTLIMIMEAVGKNPESVTPSLYKELESYSKIRLKSYRTLQKKFEAFLTQ